MQILSKTFISVAVASLIAGCTMFDSTAPLTPKLLSSNNTLTNKKEIEIDIMGETGSRVLINGIDANIKLSENSKVYLMNKKMSKDVPDGNGVAHIKLKLDKEGENLFNIRLVDEAGNKSNPLNIRAIRDTKAPAVAKLITKTPIVLTNEDSVNVEIASEENAIILIDGAISPVKLINNRATLTLPFPGKDAKRDFKIQLKDDAKNISEELIVTVYRDLTPPKEPIVTPPLIKTNKNEVTFNVKGEEGAKVYLNGKDTKSIIKNGEASIKIKTPEKDGDFKYSVTLIDSYNNQSKATQFEIIKDATPPQKPIIKPEITETNRDNFKITISGEEGAKVYLNGKDTKTIIKNGKDVLLLSTPEKDGEYQYRVSLLDSFNNMSGESQFKVIRDTTPPEVALLKTKIEKTNKNSEEIEISGEEGSLIFLNGKEIGKISNGIAKIKLDLSGKDGEKEFNIVLKDKLLNSSKPLTFSIIKDTTPPKTPEIVGNFKNYTNKSKIEVTTTDEIGSTLFINGKKIKVAKSNKITFPLILNEGKNSFKITLKDELQNESKPLNLTIIKDTIAPLAPKIKDDKRYTNQDFTQITVLGEPASTLLINGKNTKMSANSRGEIHVKLNTSGIDGKKSYIFELLDRAGNKSKPYKYSIIKDITAPKMPQFRDLPIATEKNYIDLVLIGEEGDRLVLNDKPTEIFIDKNGRAKVELNTSGEDGAREFKFAFMDRANNISPTKKVIIYKDTKAPEKPTFNKEKFYTNEDEIKVEVIGEKGTYIYLNGENTEIALNSLGRAPLTINTSGVDGEKDFKVSLVDLAGHQSKSSLLKVFKDITAPKSPTIKDAPTLVNKSGVEIKVLGEKGATLVVDNRVTEFKINSNGEIKLPLTLSGLDGKKEFQIALQDSAGNRSKAITYIVTKDVTPPKEPIISTTIPKITNRENLKIKIEGEKGTTLFINGKKVTKLIDGVKEVKIALSGKDGKKEFKLKLQDRAGNFSKEVAFSTIKDTTPPKSVELNYPIKTNQESVIVEIKKGEKNSFVYFNDIKVSLNEKGEGKATLKLSGKDRDFIFNVSLADTLGNRSKPKKIIISKDSTPPEKPIIKELPKYTTGDLEYVVISGEINSEVFLNGKNTDIKINSNALAKIPLNTSGLDGIKKFDITLKDELGNESEKVVASIIKDTIAPKAPKISLQTEATNKKVIEFIVSGEEGTDLFINDEKITTMPKGAILLQGDMSKDPDGEIVIKAYLQDKAGNRSDISTATIFKDTTPPAKPKLITPVESNTTQEIIQFTIEGEKASEIFVNNEDMNRVIKENGRATLQFKLSLGENRFLITLKDALGNKSEPLEVKIFRNEMKKVVENNITTESNTTK